MPRVVFNCHVMGVPNGGGATHTYNEGDVADITDAEYRLLDGRRTQDGTRWIRLTKNGTSKAGVPEKKPHQCVKCGRRFRYPSDLHKHVATHASKGAYICKVCGAEFASGNALGGHAKTHSEIFRQNRVDPVTGRSIPRHVATGRTKTGSWKCPEPDCYRSFTTKQGMQVHIGRQHGNDDEIPNL